MAKGSKTTDAEVEAAKEIYEVARREADTEIQKVKADLEAAKEDYEAIGFIKSTDMNIEFNKLMKYLAIYKILKTKDYKKAGLTKEQFLDSIGEAYMTTERAMECLGPIYEQFSTKMVDFSGLKFNEIKLLGKAKSIKMVDFEGEHITYKDEKYHLSEAPIVIRRIEEDMKAQIEERDAELSVKEKRIKQKDDLIAKQEKALRKFEKEAKAKGLSAEEDAFLQQMEHLRTGFDGYLLRVDPENFKEELVGELTPRMTAALLSTLQYMKMQVNALYDVTVERYGDATLLPEEGWQPPLEARG